MNQNNESVSSKKNTPLLPCTVIQSVVCFVIGFFGLYGFSLIFSLLPLGNDPAIINFLTYLTLIIVFLIYLWNSKLLKPILKSFNPDSIGFGIGMGVALVAGSMLIGNACAALGDLLGISVDNNDNQELIEQAIFAYPVLSFLMTCIFAPIAEELTYRVGLFGGIAKHNKTLGYVVAVLFFGLIHFNFASENMANELLNLPSYLFAGFMLAFTYGKNGDISSSMVAHAFNNTLSFVLSFLLPYLQ